MSALDNLTDEELRAELTRREKERDAEAIRERRARFATLIQHREVLLELVPHSRTSCSDSDTINGLGSADYGPRCSRCALLELTEFAADDYDCELTLNFVAIREG